MWEQSSKISSRDRPYTRKKEPKWNYKSSFRCPGRKTWKMLLRSCFFFCPKKKKRAIYTVFFPFIYPETFRIISKISHCSKMKHGKEKHRKSRTENSQDEQSADFENILLFLATALVENSKFQGEFQVKEFQIIFLLVQLSKLLF